jgi:hypothetical protein
MKFFVTATLALVCAACVLFGIPIFAMDLFGLELSTTYFFLLPAMYLAGVTFLGAGNIMNDGLGVRPTKTNLEISDSLLQTLLNDGLIKSHTFHTLLEAGYRELADLSALSQSEILQIKGVGETIYEDIEGAQRDLGIGT